MPEYHCQQVTYVSGISMPVRIRVEITSRGSISEQAKQSLIRVLEHACDGVKAAEERAIAKHEKDVSHEPND